MDKTAQAAARRRARPEDAPAREAGSASFLVGLWVMVALFALVTAVWSQHMGIPLRDPGGKMFSRRLTTAVIMLGVLALVDTVLRTRRSGWSLRTLVSTLRARWLGWRLVLAVTGLLAYHIVYVCYRNLKSWNAFNPLRDVELLRFDSWLFFGNSPAVLLHEMLGENVAAYVLMIVYKSFTYMVPLSVVAALAFTDRIRDGYVFLLSACWVWILGVGSYYLLPSLGPFAIDAANFGGLRRTTITTTQAEYLRERAHLLARPEAGDAFASIGAFASLHVAFTCMVVLMLRYYGLTWAARAMGVYLIGTVLATVYFGWHYVVDDVAGVAIAALAVLLGRLMVYPQGRPPESRGPEPGSVPA